MLMAVPITLQRYFTAPPEEAGPLLAGIFSEWAEPLIRRIVRHRIGPADSGAREVEDVCSEATVRLLIRFDDLRAQRTAAEIEDFDAYVAAICHYTVNEHFRRARPRRHSVRNKLRYLLKPERGLDLWDSAEGVTVCGRVGWRGRAVSRAAIPNSPTRTSDAVALVMEILDHAGGPIDFDTLVDTVCRSWNVHDRPTPLHYAEAHTAAPTPDRDTLLINRDRVRILWDTILDLPVPQRAALLLNLRDANGANALVWLPAAGVATVRRIAEALTIPLEEFVDLWRRLPLPDLDIASRLGVTRQQVINLRAAARKRLARNLEARS